MARFTVLGRLVGIVPAPPNAPIPTPTTQPEPQWVVEGNPIPLGKIDFDAPRTAISKFAIIVAFADELVRKADERGLSLIERVTLMTIIRNEGGTFELINGGENFNCNLDGVRDFKGKDPMMIMRAVFGLRAEIIELLRGERIYH